MILPSALASNQNRLTKDLSLIKLLSILPDHIFLSIFSTFPSNEFLGLKAIFHMLIAIKSAKDDDDADLIRLRTRLTRLILLAEYTSAELDNKIPFWFGYAGLTGYAALNGYAAWRKLIQFTIDFLPEKIIREIANSNNTLNTKLVVTSPIFTMILKTSNPHCLYLLDAITVNNLRFMLTQNSLDILLDKEGLVAAVRQRTDINLILSENSSYYSLLLDLITSQIQREKRDKARHLISSLNDNAIDEESRCQPRLIIAYNFITLGLLFTSCYLLNTQGGKPFDYLVFRFFIAMAGIGTVAASIITCFLPLADGVTNGIGVMLLKLLSPVFGYLACLAYGGYQFFHEFYRCYVLSQLSTLRSNPNMIPEALQSKFQQKIERASEFEALPTEAEVERARQLHMPDSFIQAMCRNGIFQQLHELPDIENSLDTDNLIQNSNQV